MFLEVGIVLTVLLKVSFETFTKFSKVTFYKSLWHLVDYVNWLQATKIFLSANGFT